MWSECVLCCILFLCYYYCDWNNIIYFVHFFPDFSFSMQVKRIKTWLNDDKILLFITLCRLNGVVLVVFHQKIFTWCTATLRPMRITSKMNFCGRNYFVLSFLWLIIIVSIFGWYLKSVSVHGLSPGVYVYANYEQ